MTTIVYRDGVMVSDGRSTLNDIIISDATPKIVRLSDGALFALSGESRYASSIVAYLEEEEGAELPKLEEPPFTAILVEKDGVIKMYEGEGEFMTVYADFIAIGSGSHFAYGALELGVTAEEAVRTAIKRDPLSGGVLQIEKLGHIEPTEEAYSGPY